MLELADLAEHVYLIGGQVLSVRERERGRNGVIEIETPTGVRIDRGFSLEPDLLLDIDGMGPRSDALVDVLRRRGYRRARDFRWLREIDGHPVEIDLFRPESSDRDYAPTGMIVARGGDLAMARALKVRLGLQAGTLEIAVPDAVGFLAMKIAAKDLRPKLSKDCFDIYAYVWLTTPEATRAALNSAGADGKQVRAGLQRLFGALDAVGVQDVIAYASTLSDFDRSLLERTVADAMAIVLSR
jgi:hypothetical protein